MKSSKSTSAKGTNRKFSYEEGPATRILSMTTINDCERIAGVDAEAVSTDRQSYVKKNSLTYYLLINTWVLQVLEGGERGCLDLLEAISTKGLISVIAECATFADELIQADFRKDDITMPDYLVGVLSQARNDKEALQWLRYPKRFSPDGADLLQAESIKAFLAVNRRCKNYTRDGYPQYWVRSVRERVHDMLHGYAADWSTGFFSAGVAADADRPLMDKLFAYSDWDPALFHDVSYPIGHCPRNPWSGPAYIKRVGIPSLNWWGPPDLSSILPFTAEVRAVPKSYKSSRIIAMEHAYRQFHMQAIRIAFEQSLRANGYEDMLDLHDQRPNQRLAFEGSVDGRFATIDLSSASDSLSRDLAYSVLPIPVIRDLEMYLPRYFKVPGDANPRLMHMFCTSGSAVTFPVESIVFLAIMLEVRDAATRFTGEEYSLPQVFGDDLVIDVRLFDTAVDVLTRLGFVVNVTKSFGSSSRYRESCGVEFFAGYDTSTRYWPRTVLRWSNDGVARSIEAMCALQHRLYGSYRCQKFLASVVRTLEPRMTSHNPGVDCSDLWEPVPRFLPATAPVEGDVQDSAALRELHLTLKTRRTNRSNLTAASGFSGKQVVEMWRFVHFLRYGRAFDTELDRLLGVSSKPPTLASDCDTGEVYWAYVKE